MAFNNTVPYTLEGSYDSDTNLITLIASEYIRDTSTGLYSILRYTESFSIPAQLAGYKRETDQVFIVTSDAQDQFSIRQGWYDIDTDTHYSSITSALDDKLDALIAQNTGGGGAAYYELSEADAITAIGADGLIPGAMYRITLDGTSQGFSGHQIWLPAVAVNEFGLVWQYFNPDADPLRYLNVRGHFDADGYHHYQNDMDAECELTTEFDSGDDNTLVIANTIFGFGRLVITSTVSDLITISGGYEGNRLMLFSSTYIITPLAADNIILDATLGAPEINEGNQSFFSVMKRGANWIETGRLTL